MRNWNCRQVLSGLGLSVALLCFGMGESPCCADEPAKPAPRQRRVLYNFDGDSCFSTKGSVKGPAPVNAEEVRKLVAEVAYEGSQVDTILLCVNAQVMYYPTKVGTLRGTLSTPEQRAKWPPSEQQRFANMEAFYSAGEDPYAILLAEARKQGREALISIRMNDNHGNDFLKTQFFVDHPDCRLGHGALKFDRAEVREYVFRLIEEAARRYECDGVELDFNRFPTFFAEGTAPEQVKKMNELVERIRTMLDEVGRERKQRLVLAVRIPSNYNRELPTPATALALGCDVPGWVKAGWVDFVTVSEFLHERYNLPIKAWKEAITTVPVYGGIECYEPGGKYLTPEKYRQASKLLTGQGADGVYLFNFFTTRENGKDATEPPFEVLRDLKESK